MNSSFFKTGTALWFSTDGDNDGLSDASEFNLVAREFDWKKSNNLTHFPDFPALPGSTATISPQRDAEFPSTDNAAFYRIGRTPVPPLYRPQLLAFSPQPFP